LGDMSPIQYRLNAQRVWVFLRHIYTKNIQQQKTAIPIG
jgi:hypothetical protein